MYVTMVNLLDCCSKADARVAHVELGVVLSNEDISKDPPGSHRQVQTHESRNALRLSKLGHLKDILRSSERELLSSDDEVNDGEVVEGVAVNDVLSGAGKGLPPTDHFVDSISFRCGANQQA